MLKLYHKPLFAAIDALNAQADAMEAEAQRLRDAGDKETALAVLKASYSIRKHAKHVSIQEKRAERERRERERLAAGRASTYGPLTVEPGGAAAPRPAPLSAPAASIAPSLADAAALPDAVRKLRDDDLKWKRYFGSYDDESEMDAAA